MRIAAGVVAFGRTVALLLLSSAASVGAAGTAPDPLASARESFLEAYGRVATEAPDAALNDSEQLRRYVLYPYLEAARIRHALSTLTSSATASSASGNGTSNGTSNASSSGPAPADAQAAAFVAANLSTPVGRSLRRVWLDNLARRSEWTQFLDAYHDTGNDLSSRCESYTARIALNRTTGLAAEVLNAWLSPRSLAECDSPFAWLKDNGQLTAEVIEKRVRLVLENGNVSFARKLLAGLPPERAAPLEAWAQLLESPANAIDALIGGDKSPAEPAAVLAGWSRLTRIDPNAAKDRFANLVKARNLSHEAASPYALALALGLAWNREPEALQYFDQVNPKDMDDAAQEWRARAALWEGSWDQAQKAIAALSPGARQSPRWRYWAARIAEQRGNSAHAQELYTSLLADDNYYSGMAAAHLNQPVIPHPQPIPVDPAVQSRLEQILGMQRARELFKSNMRAEALSEWSQAYESLTGEARQQAIVLAKSWGWYDQAVTVAATQHIFNDYELLYPTPYESEVDKAAEAAQVSRDMVYGVLRQESLYRVDAVSSAGARGLMQLQPSTAQRAARTSKLAVPSIDLFVPAVNTILGAARLRQLLDLFEGQTPLALAGYNAGTNAVRRWLPQHPLDSDIWIENIPYNETRGYVQRVLWHSLLYTWLRQQEAQPTRSWLDPIRPTQAAEDRIAESTPSPHT